MDQVEIKIGKVADAATIARQRCEMFREMGTLAAQDYDALLTASQDYFEAAMRDDRYVAWFAHRGSEIVAGGGMQINTIPPRPGPGGLMLRAGPQGLIVNIYVEPAWRRRGIAEQLVRQMIRFASMSGIPSVVLHASEAGRPLYEKLGFALTSEMRLYT